ncbi:hypothetical protein PNEG_00413 [Pneumocystis murina B123]|uniref:Uncharacterized protein n=1 Tax=Pneumocystis murina (strain B123) TaxID=1069680 RepID=M7PLQ6_PNEMU|nr:hypothetical protein PNEG_00413 [Pneumocystis murina B123]EMR11389.1 hypothetical protein PNEG_00413 [Pneumocystis murina B123]
MNLMEKKRDLKLQEIKENNSTKLELKDIIYENELDFSEKRSFFSEIIDGNKKKDNYKQLTSIFEKGVSFRNKHKKENKEDYDDYKNVENLSFLNVEKIHPSFSGNFENKSETFFQKSASYSSFLLKDDTNSFKHSRTQSLMSLSSINPACFNYSLDSLISSSFEDSKDGERSFNFEDAICWSKLKEINSQIFTEFSKEKFGSPVSMSISNIIAIGTSKGLILVFDYRQVLRHIIGMGTKAMDSGSTTSISISDDCMFLCSGHSKGYIFVWELRIPTNPVITISPIVSDAFQNIHNNGHLDNSKICHIAFVNSYYSIVSSDIHGMTFYHILNRTIISNSLLSIRLAGHYLTSPSFKKSDIILALTSLSMKNSKKSSDSIILIAILTSYKLSIISTTPVLKTQFIMTKPKSLKISEYTLGTLSWFSCEKFKKNDIENTDINKNKIRLLCSRENHLFVIEIRKKASEHGNSKDILPLSFKTISEWKEREPVLASQWFNMTILVILSKSQEIFIINVETMESFFSCNISSKGVLVMDPFNDELIQNKMTNKSSERNLMTSTMFCQSFFIFKKKFFLLCKDNVFIGILPNWEHKLSLVISSKEFIKAISLMNLYYKGNCEKIILGLPLDDDLRHELLQEKLLKTIDTSLEIILDENSSSLKNNIISNRQIKKKLAFVCIEACINMKITDFLFNDIYDRFKKTKNDEIFLESLETFILIMGLKIIHPNVMKDMIVGLLKKKLYLRLKDIIFKIDFISLDIQETLKICHKEELYDILIYIWTQAFNDFITPIIHFLGLIVFFLKNKNIQINQEQKNNSFSEDIDILASQINELFLYLSHSLSGRIYPIGLDMNKNISFLAKSSIYWFIFSGTNIIWPKNNGILIKLNTDDSQELTFPYLRLILNYNAQAFLSLLDDVFGDNFLNEIDNNSKSSSFSEIKITRQLIINILLEIMQEETYSQSIIYLYIFIASSISKYRQFILLSGSVLEKILIGLAKNSNQDISDQCQLSINYILSFYRPNDIDYLINLYEKVGFYKVLKFIYKQEKMFLKLLKIHIEDKSEPNELFRCIKELFQLQNQSKNKKILKIHKIILEYSEEICSIDATRFSLIVDKYLPELHTKILKKLKIPIIQYNYLKCILNSSELLINKENVSSEDDIIALNDQNNSKIWITKDILELFINFLCSFEIEKVTDYIKSLNINDIDVDNVLLILENYRIIDAIVYLLSLEGKNIIAFEKILEYIAESMLEIDMSLKLETYVNDINALDFNHIKKQLGNVEKNIITGIYLCEQYFLEINSKKNQIFQDSLNPFDLSLLNSKFQWIKLLEVIIKISQIMLTKLSNQFLKMSSENLSYNLTENKSLLKISNISEKIGTFMQNSIQNIFTSLYNLTSLSNSHSIIFLHVLEQFFEIITSLSLPILEFKELLINIFKNYKYDERLLIIINSILHKDLFKLMKYDNQIKKKGSKVQFNSCGVCEKDIWNPEDIISFLHSFGEKKQQEEVLDVKQEHSYSLIKKGDNFIPSFEEKKIIGKKKMHTKQNSADLLEYKDLFIENEVFPKIIVFMCGHNYHENCLYNIQKRRDFTCILCGTD